jgi:hypothetical protein
VFGWKNPGMANAERVQKVSRLIWSSLIINTLFEDVIGINSPLPAPERVLVEGIRDGKTVPEMLVGVAKELAESVPIIGGTIKYTTASRESLPPVAQQAKDATRLVYDVGEAFSKMDLSKVTKYDLEALGKFFGVPGSSEVFKILRRIKAGMPWYDVILGKEVPKKKSQADKIRVEDNLR